VDEILVYYRDLGKHVWYPYRDFAVRVIARTLCFGALCKEGLLWRLSSKEEHVAYQWLAQAYYQEERPFEDTMEEAHGSGAGTASGGGLEKHASGNPEDLGHFVAYRSQEGIGKAPHGNPEARAGENVVVRGVPVFDWREFKHTRSKSWDKTCQLIENMVRMVARGKRPFVTEGGYIGLGPPTMEEGDAVHLVEGGLCPYILRTAELGPEGPLERWQVVGECYVDGIKDGEAVEGVEWEDVWLV